MRESPAKIATIVGMLVLAAPIVIGQRDSTVLRTVRGTVVDSQGRVLASSVVYLYQQKTQAVRTHIADDSGHYRFSGLSPRSDYQIHTEHADWTSSVHMLSAADGKRDVVLDLKVDKRKTRMSLLPEIGLGKTCLPLLRTGWRSVRRLRRLMAFVGLGP